jgi:hypothetical protein
MTNKEISEQLLKIVSSDDFARSSGELTETWSAEAVGVESIDVILEFMEAHPDLGYGMPGPLVHFVEEFYQKGYEEKLINSISRRPTMLTVWMLNRVINGAREPETNERLISTMRQAATNPKSDRQTRDRVNGFLQCLGS